MASSTNGRDRWFAAGSAGASVGCLVVVLTAVVSAQAQEASPNQSPTFLEQAGITGSMRAGYWSSTRDLDPEDHLGAGMFWLKASRPISDRVAFLLEGWAAVEGPLDDPDATGELREAFIDVRVARLDVRMGRQIFAWGRADGVNPTDNLTGEDLTLLAPDDDDRRLGTTAVRASYYVGDVSVSGLWLPEFRGHRFPLPAQPSELTFVREPDEWPLDQWAVRVEQTGGAIDWSVSYFDGLDLTPDLGLQQESDRPGGPAHVRLSHHRVRVLGADMAANAGRIGLRAEVAYVDTEDASGLDPHLKNPSLFLVAGGDRTFREYLNLNVQYLYRLVLDYHPLTGNSSPLAAAVSAQQAIFSSQATRVQHGASFRLAYKWLRETLEAECAAAGFLEPGGVTLRPKIVYALSDHWKALAGAELFRGEGSSLFGLLRPNSTAYLEARWSF